MKSAKANILFCIAVLALMSSDPALLSAQPYEHSVGVRAGYSSGIVYKAFFRHRMTAIEGGLLYNRHGFNLTALGEYHPEVFRNKRILVYVGGGVFGGQWDDEFSLGIAGVAGIEYVLRDLPLSFSADWKPMLNLIEDFEPDWLDFGVSIRYHFKI
jgi:hypothetical protein